MGLSAHHWQSCGSTTMLRLEMREPSGDFARCWNAAGSHLNIRSQGAIRAWLKADLNPPFLEHLSFRLGNQLFFIRIEDMARELDLPGSRVGLLEIANRCRGHACVMPMRRYRGTWVPEFGGWGLLDARTGHIIDPSACVMEVFVEMTDWEVHDFAVQVIREKLRGTGHEIMSWQGNPDIDPSIWFVGGSGPAWVIVRASRCALCEAMPPSNWRAIADGCAKLSRTGYFASVVVESSSDPGHDDMKLAPLWRGSALCASISALRMDPYSLRN